MALVTFFALYHLLSGFALSPGGLATLVCVQVLINTGMTVGLVPITGLSLPLVSYGGSAMLVLMVAFGIVHSAHIHRPRQQMR